MPANHFSQKLQHNISLSFFIWATILNIWQTGTLPNMNLDGIQISPNKYLNIESGTNMQCLSKLSSNNGLQCCVCDYWWKLQHELSTVWPIYADNALHNLYDWYVNEWWNNFWWIFIINNKIGAVDRQERQMTLCFNKERKNYTNLEAKHFNCSFYARSNGQTNFW